MPSQRVSRVTYGLGAIAAYLIIYESVASSLKRYGILPPVEKIVCSFMTLVENGLLQSHILASLYRVLGGLAIGIVLGVSLGSVMAVSKKFDNYFSPIYNFMRAIPPIAFVTLFILWVGIGELPKIILITIGVMMFTTIPTYHGVKDVPDVYIKAGLVLGADKKMLLRKVILPAASPQILVGLRFSVMIAWGTIVAAELIASKSGIGYLIIEGQRLFHTDTVLIGIVTLTAVALVMDTLVRLAISYFTRWMKRGMV